MKTERELIIAAAIVGVLGIVFLISRIGEINGSKLPSPTSWIGSDSSRAASIYSTDYSDGHIDEMKGKIIEFAEGTWTFTGDTQGDTLAWFRITVDKNGAMTFQIAKPAESNWGDSMSATLTPATDKFKDTGKRWFGFTPSGSDSSFAFIIGQDGTLSIIGENGKAVPLEHHDASPFSK